MSDTETRAMRRILHVDMDAFYASVEQRDRPELRGRPVAVGRGKVRGVVAAASYEARAFGVKSAMPSLVAARQCPDLVFIAPRFDLYRAVSAQIHAIFRRHTSLIQPLSLDEAYLDVTGTCAEGRAATDIAREIRAAIRAETGLTASAGVSFNKFLAKLASDQDKPDGLTVIRPGAETAFVAALPVGRFHGVGPVTEERMRKIGVQTGADLAALSLEDLRLHFGNAADHYHRIARGIDDRPVEVERERKSVGAEMTFDTDFSEIDPARTAMIEIAERVAERAERQGVAGHTLTLKITYADFEKITRRRTLADPIATADDIHRIATAILSEISFSTPVRLIGISLSGLTRQAPNAQPGLFDFDNHDERTS